MFQNITLLLHRNDFNKKRLEIIIGKKSNKPVYLTKEEIIHHRSHMVRL